MAFCDCEQTETKHGHSLYGRLDDKPFDDEGEDFFFGTSDELLDFLNQCGMLALLTLPSEGTTND